MPENNSVWRQRGLGNRNNLNVETYDLRPNISNWKTGNQLTSEDMKRPRFTLILWLAIISFGAYMLVFAIFGIECIGAFRKTSRGYKKELGS